MYTLPAKLNEIKKKLMITATVSPLASIPLKKSPNNNPNEGTDPNPQIIGVIRPKLIIYPHPPSDGIYSYFLPSLIIFKTLL